MTLCPSATPHRSHPTAHTPPALTLTRTLATCRGQMDGRVKELQLKVSKFAARWNELKPKKLEAADPEAMAAVIARVKEWEEEFGDLEVTTERIAQDCHVTPNLRPHIPRYR